MSKEDLTSEVKVRMEIAKYMDYIAEIMR